MKRTTSRLGPMRRFFRPRGMTAALLCAIAASSISQASFAQTSPDAFTRPGHKLIAGLWTKPLATVDFADILQLESVGRDLRFQINPSKQVEQLIRGRRAVLIEINDSRFGWHFDLQSRVWNPGRTSAANFGRLLAVSEETYVPGVLELRAVIVTPRRTDIVAQRVEPTGAITSVTLTRSDAAISIDIKRDEARDLDQNVVAPAFSYQFSAPHFWAATQSGSANEAVRAAREFVGPMLRQLGDRQALTPGPSDIYRAFDDVEPLPAARQLVDTLLADLSNTDPASRNRAAIELRQASTQLVPSLLRIDLDSLTQGSRLVVQKVIDDASRYPDQTPQQLRSSRDFLVESLRFPDRKVRQRAADILRSQFQIDAPIDPSDREIDQLHLKAITN